MSHVVPRSLVLALLVTISSEARAGFLAGKPDWDDLSGEEKNGYVMGVFDDSTMLTTDAPGRVQYRKDLIACVMQIGMSSHDLMELIDLGYQEPSKWQMPPNLVLAFGLQEVCLAHINRLRTARGEQPLE